MAQRKVTETGIFLDKETFCLGASPDGLIGQDEILGIKCIFSLKDKSVAKWVRKSQAQTTKVRNVPNMPYLKAGLDSVEFNSNRTYYDQIQGQLLFTGMYIQIVE